MYPPATLFLDVCVQSELWPDGAWPLVSDEQADRVTRLFALARAHDLRQGGVVCRHVSSDATPAGDVPLHCQSIEAADRRPAGCLPILPLQVWTAEGASDHAPALDRARAVYVDSGCGHDPDDLPRRARVFAHLTAGVRDAVVFGAGVEHGLRRVVDALLRRRIRIHVALDAVGTRDEVRAQVLVAGWKRRGVDGVTVEIVERMLRRR